MPTPFPAAAGVRLAWPDLPESVRAGVEELLGSRVVKTISQPNGFSPGAALRLQLADGRRAFVKAVGAQPNPESPKMHREKARCLELMPRSAPVPQLIGVYDEGDWVAVILEDVAGRYPHLPWRIDELKRVMAAIERLQAEFTPCPVPNLPTVVERHQDTFDGWRELAKEPDRKLGPWARRHLVRLAELEVGWAEAVAGDTLLNADLRADNLLFTEAGSVVFLDWPGACRGAAWFDPLVMAPSVVMQGGPDPE
ncbi:MAG: phosphotransferase [Candidatus Dormiibacterota bacterium]